MLLCEDLLLLLQEPLPLFGDFCPASRNRFLLGGKPLLALHELAVSVNLRLEGRLLFLEELDDLLLPSRDFVLAGGDLPHLRDRLGISMGNVFFAPHERVEPLREFLFPTHELVLLRQDLLFRRGELLFPLIDAAFLLFQFLFTSPKALLAAYDGIPLFREGGPFLFRHSAVFVQLRGLLLE